MKSQPANKLKTCQCYANISKAIRKYTTKHLKCDVFNKTAKYLPRQFAAECNKDDGLIDKQLHYCTLVNSYQLYPTSMIPEGVNCGLYAFSLVLQSNYDLINKLDDHGKNVNLQPLFEFPSIKGNDKKQHPEIK